MKLMNLQEMQQRVVPMVEHCIQKYEGGEKYFDNLDGLIKNDLELLYSFTEFAVRQSKTKTVIVSGEIGSYLTKIIPKNVNLICVPGGLRKEVMLNPISCDKGIFIDDSFYSGKTYKKVKSAVELGGGTLCGAYVFYDGSLARDKEVFSLYRYYKEGD